MDLPTLVSLISSIPYAGPVLVYLPVVVSIGALISVVVPAPPETANGAYKAAYWVLQWCALNKGHAVNLSSPDSVGIVGGPGAITAPQVSTASKPATTSQGATP